MPAEPALTLRQRLVLIITRWQARIGMVLRPYRPELHYMRGPGPRWRAKYGQLAASIVRRPD